MKPLWLELMLTPMAAPETPGLRRMRLAWQSLCLALAGSILCFSWLRSIDRITAPLLVAALLIVALAQGIVYWRRKLRADAVYLDRQVGEPS